MARKKWDATRDKVPQARALDDPMVGVDVERFGTTRFDTVESFRAARFLNGPGQRAIAVISGV